MPSCLVNLLTILPLESQVQQFYPNTSFGNEISFQPITLSGLCIFVAVWFLLGCYGLYFLIQQVSSNGPHQMPIYAGGSQREIVLRIVQDSSVQKALNQHTIVAAAAEAIKGVGGGEL
jgi:hypothetical protein